MSESSRPEWSLLSVHGLVLFFLAMNPRATQRDMALRLGVSERTIHSVVKDLAAVRMLTIERSGRQNRYVVNPDAHFIHPEFAHLRVADFLRPFNRA